MPQTKVHGMSTCVYEGYTGQAFGLVLTIHWIIPIFIWGASITKDRRGRFGFEFTTFWYGLYLTLWLTVIYILQMSLQMMRHDPFCSQIVTAAFPSVSTFYLSSGLSFTILLTFIWNIPLNWKYWIYLLVVVIIPPCYLVWLEYNQWWEILVTALIGFASSILYFVLLWSFYSHLPQVLNSFPCTWFRIVDTYLTNADEEAETERIRLVLQGVDEKLRVDLTI